MNKKKVGSKEINITQAMIKGNYFKKIIYIIF